MRRMTQWVLAVLVASATVGGLGCSSDDHDHHRDRDRDRRGDRDDDRPRHSPHGGRSDSDHD